MDVEDLVTWLRDLPIALRMLTLSKPFEEQPVEEKKVNQNKSNKIEFSKHKEQGHKLKYSNFTPTLHVTSISKSTPEPTSPHPSDVVLKFE